VPWAHDKLKEQAAVDNVATVGDLQGEVHQQPDRLRISGDYHAVLQDDDVRQKGKHKQKTILVEKAQRRVKESMIAAESAPTFAIDVEGPAFRKMTESSAWLTDDEQFRSILNSASSSKRDYITSIRKTIRNTTASRQVQCYWLFSLREDRAELVILSDPQ